MNRTVKWYHCIELNPAFCDSDDVKYGNLHKNLKWARTGTIGKERRAVISGSLISAGVRIIKIKASGGLQLYNWEGAAHLAQLG